MRRRFRDALAFGGAAGAVGVSAVLAQVLCPGSCVGCGSCVASVAPMAGATVVLGAAVTGPMIARALRRVKATPGAGARD